MRANPYTQIRNTRTCDLGTLVRLDAAGEPVVKYFGDHTEYPSTWAQVEIIDSSEHQLVPGSFYIGLYVDDAGDVWRRHEAAGSPLPCTEQGGHEFDNTVAQTRGGVECAWCGAEVEPIETFTLVQVHGIAARSARPQTRAEIEEYCGPLHPAGSREARAIRNGTQLDTDSAVATGYTVVALVILALGTLLWGLGVWLL